MALDTDREQRLDEIIADYLDAVAAGQAPDRQTLLSQHVDLAEELNAYFHDQDRLEGVMAPLRVAQPTTNTYHPSTAEHSGEPLGPGSRFGEYEVLSVIARSGMGIVYRARQFVGTGEPRPSRVVALKMIRAGLWATEDDARRFQIESEAAASLDHPNIVPIYEAGVWRAGEDSPPMPFFSMKLIEGGSLSQRIDGNPQPPCDAARLVALVARAVDFAHQRGILHRDLKPANILLDGENRPYLTDFGLAKRIQRDTDLTPSGITVGTPSYMAPEQAFPARSSVSSSAGALTTRADVYGLGAVLFEMLTGRPPFRAETPLETLLEVLEKPTPSPRGLSSAVDRDLEIICLKCLEKDPAHRYTTAAELADDLERYLRGEPINARPSGLLERAWRRIKRQPVVFGLLFALGLSLVGGVAAVAMQWRRAENHLTEVRIQRKHAEDNLTEANTQRLKAEKNESEANIQKMKAEKNAEEANEQRKKALEEYRLFNRAVSDLCQRITTKVAAETPGSSTLQRIILTAAVPHFEGFVKRYGHDPVVESNLALTYLYLGELHINSGAPSDGLALYEKARSVLEWLDANHPNGQRRENLAVVHYRLGALLLKGQKEGGFKHFERARELSEALCKRDDPNPENLGLLATTYNRLAYFHFDEQRYARAEEYWVQHVALMRELVRRASDVSDNRRSVANGLLNIAHSRARDGRRESANAMYREALDEFRPLLTGGAPIGLYVNSHNALEQLAATGAGRGAMLREISVSHRGVGHAYRSAKRYDDALIRYREARKAAEEWIAKESESVEARNEVAKCHYDMAIVYERIGETEEAVRALEASRDLRRPLVEREPMRRELLFDLGLTLTFLGSKFSELGRDDDAQTVLREGAEQYRLALNGAASNKSMRVALATNLLTQSELARKTGRFPDAEAALAERRRLVHDVPAELYATAREFAALARLATGGKTRPSPEEEAMRRRCSILAVETLKQTFDAGYKDVEAARKDASFAPLRRLPEFNALFAKPGK